MIIPDRDKFTIELNKVEDSVSRELLISLYDHLSGGAVIDNPLAAVDRVLHRLFPPGFLENDILIPLRFNFTTLGQVVFGVIYGNNSGKLYSVKELIDLTKTSQKPKGLSKQYIYQEIKNESGFFHGRAIYKGSWFIPESVVLEFLETKGYLCK